MSNAKMKALRDSKGLTQAEVAEAAGISVRGYQNYEAGIREPAVTIALRIADALETDVKTLFPDYHKPTRTG